MSTIATMATAARKPLDASLFVQVPAGLGLGIALGMIVPDFAVRLKILSDAFLKLISMIVAPILFCVVVHGIAGAGSRTGPNKRADGVPGSAIVILAATLNAVPSIPAIGLVLVRLRPRGSANNG